MSKPMALRVRVLQAEGAVKGCQNEIARLRLELRGALDRIWTLEKTTVRREVATQQPPAARTFLHLDAREWPEQTNAFRWQRHGA